MKFKVLIFGATFFAVGALRAADWSKMPALLSYFTSYNSFKDRYIRGDSITPREALTIGDVRKRLRGPLYVVNKRDQQATLGKEDILADDVRLTAHPELFFILDQDGALAKLLAEQEEQERKAALALQAASAIAHQPATVPAFMRVQSALAQSASQDSWCSCLSWVWCCRKQKQA